MMRTESKLARYEECLKSNIRRSRFSVNAFLFNSFYYLYFKMFAMFSLYFFGGLFLVVSGFFLTRSLWVVAGIMLTLRLINALTASYAQQQYMKAFVRRNQEINYRQPVIFYQITAKQLAVCSFLSGGLFEFYWMYKNWKIIRETVKDQEIHPISQSLLGIFYISSLLNVIRMNLKRSKTEGKNFNIYAGCCTAFLTLQVVSGIFLLAFLPGRISLLLIWGIYLAAWIGSIWGLSVLQKRINFHNRKSNLKLQMPNRLQLVPLIFVFLGLLLSGGLVALRQPAKQNDIHLGIVLNSTYRMINGYADFCRKQGYEMTRFPQVYIRYFHPELEIVNQRLKHYNLTLEQAWSYFKTEQNSTPDDNIMNEFANLKPLVIEHIIQQHKTDPNNEFDEDVAREYLNKEITLPVICAETDNNAEQILDHNKTYQKFFRDTVDKIR